MSDQREPITETHVQMIARSLGLGAILLDLNNVDYTRGTVRTANGRKFWLTDGRCVTLTLLPSDGDGPGFMAGVSKEPDRNRPEPMYAPPLHKCICPDCANMVDRQTHKSGACRKDHMNYECTHPACIQRAVVNHWPRATHPHDCKIGAAHWQYRKRAD